MQCLCMASSSTALLWMWLGGVTGFLSRVSILLLTRDIDIAILSVCLSVRLFVRPSVCPWHAGIVWKRLNISSQFFHHTVAQSFQFYEHQTSSRNSDRVTPCGGAKYRWGIKIARFSTNKLLYLANDIRYGRRIGNLEGPHIQISR